MRAIAILTILCGLGFGLPGIFGLRHFAQHNSIWTFMGYPTYGHGPFEKIGLHTSVPLLAGFLTVCIAELVVGGTGNPPTCGWRWPCYPSSCSIGSASICRSGTSWAWRVQCW